MLAGAVTRPPVSGGGGAQALTGKAAIAASAKATTLDVVNGVSQNFASTKSPLTTIFNSSGSSSSVSGGQLHTVLGTLGGYSDLIIEGFDPSSDDYTWSVDVELNSTTGEHFVRVIWRADTTNGNDYMLEVGIDATNACYVFGGTRAAFAPTSLGGAGGLSITAGTIFHLKGRSVGTSLQAKFWRDSESEPGTWNVMDTTSTHRTTGMFGLVSQGGNVGASRTHDWDNLAIVYGS